MSTIPTTPTTVGALSSTYQYVLASNVTPNGLPGLLFDGKGTTFVLVHGGPEPLGRAADLQALGNRLSDKGFRALCIDYHSLTAANTTDWTLAVPDVVAAVNWARAQWPDDPIVLVAHSFGGYPASVAFLQEGAADGYAAINAVSSADQFGGIGPNPPDPVKLAANRPTAPVAVITGTTMPYPNPIGWTEFVNALAAAGHPGFYTACPGDHTGTLYVDSTTFTLSQLAAITTHEVPTPMLDGIDVSVWQKTTPPLTGLSFLFARATYDTSPDTMYATHIANARKAGLRVGAYHFGTGRSTPQAQAAAFLKAAGNVDFYCLDLESDPVPMTQQQAAAFITAVKASGRQCGLYHSASGFPSLGQSYNWIAKWGTAPPVGPWAFWQYQGSPLDKDHFAGTAVDLAKLAYKPTPPTPPPPKPGTLVPMPAGTKFFAHSIDTTAVGGLAVQYGFTVTRTADSAWLGTVRCWVSGLPLGTTGQAVIPAGTKLYAHKGDTTPVGAMTARYGFTVESQSSGWTLGHVTVWVKP